MQLCIGPGWVYKYFGLDNTTLPNFLLKNKLKVGERFNHPPPSIAPRGVAASTV